MKRLLPILFFFMAGRLIFAQEPRITGFIPGNYRFDNFHRIEVSNPSGAEINMGGYLVVTRDYSVLLPAATRIPANGRITLVKKAQPGDLAPVQLGTMPDFLIRFPDREFEGNYVCIFNRDRRIVDGFLFSPLRDVPYLPDRDTCVTFKGDKIGFYLPGEREGAWFWLQGRDDPAIAFERGPTGWHIVSRKKLQTAAVKYSNFIVRYQDGIVTLRWNTANEVLTNGHIVERSEDQLTFASVGNADVRPGKEELKQYEFFDPEVKTGQTYFYRIRYNDDKQEVVSEVKQIKVEEGQEDFSMDVFFGSPPHQQELNIRFFSGYSQKIRIKVLDERFREVAVVFDGFVNARTRSLVKLREALPPGRYRVFAETETRRYAREVTAHD